MSADGPRRGGPGAFDRLRSAWYGAGLALSERLGRFRGAAAEIPCGALRGLSPEAEARVAELRARHHVAFELEHAARSALLNYEYLDLLAHAYAAAGREPPRPHELHDVGCGGFAYAAALHAWFAPRALLGYELEGYRRLQGGVNRRERALGHLRRLPGAEFVVADYRSIVRPATLITAFFPFVTPGPVLGWRLPLSVLDPPGLFAAIRRNLVDGGSLVMVNHGAEEAQLAARHARAAGLVREHAVECRRLGGEPPWPVVVGLWR